MWRLFNIAIVLLLAWSLSVKAQLPNQTLRLDGDGDFVKLPSGVVSNLSDVTIEFWVKWDDFLYYSQPVSFGEADRRNVIALNNFSGTRSVRFFLYHDLELHLASLPTFARKGQWLHFALSAGKGGMQLVCNGVPMVHLDVSFGVTGITNDDANYVGHSQWEDNLDFKGELDEIRVWDRALSIEEIQSRMFNRLKGNEPGLMALWNFDSGDASDATANNLNGEMMGDARCIVNEIPSSLPDIPLPATLAGTVVAPNGSPLQGASLSLMCNGLVQQSAISDIEGRFSMSFLRDCESYDLGIEWKNLSAWKADVAQQPGFNPEMEIILKRQTSISGTVSALDSTPQVGASIQALRKEESTGDFEVVQTTQSDPTGQFTFSNLRSGSYAVRGNMGAGFHYYRSDNRDINDFEFGSRDIKQASLIEVRPGNEASSVALRFPPAGTGRWRTFSYLDGLDTSSIHSIYEATDGLMWFGGTAGVIRFDGKNIKSFSGPKSIFSSPVRTIAEQPAGVMWFGDRHGVVQYNGKSFKRFTTADGLPSNEIYALERSNQGVLWCGGSGGLCIFENGRFRPPHNEALQLGIPIHTITFLTDERILMLTQEGPIYDHRDAPIRILPNESIRDIRSSAILLEGPKGVWLATNDGLARFRLEDDALHYDGKLTSKDGFLGYDVSTILKDSDGSIWFGTKKSGISRYDEHGVSTINSLNGLASDRISVMRLQSNGNLWVGTIGGGLSLLERSTPEVYDLSHGLPSLKTVAIEKDDAGNLWFGLEGGGVSRYDGNRFRNFSLIDSLGLKHDDVTSLAIDSTERVWTGTEDGFIGLIENNDLIHVSIGGASSLGRIEAIHFLNQEQFVVGSATGLHRIRLQGRDKNLKGDNVLDVELVETQLSGNQILDIETGEDDALWIATASDGIYLIDRNGHTHFGESDGLPNVAINDVSISQASDVYCATDVGIYHRSDGTFVPLGGSFDQGNRACFSIVESSDGKLWIGTDSAGVGIYNGEIWTSLDTRDGIAGNSVFKIFPHDDGSLWFGTNGGVTHYTPEKTHPTVSIGETVFEKPISLPSGATAASSGSRVGFNFASIDFRTSAEKRRYQTRVVPIGALQSDETPFELIEGSEVFEWNPTRPGKYQFEVQAIDRDLNYSEIATTEFVVVHPWFRKLTFVVPSIGFGVATLMAAIFFGVRSHSARRETRALSAKLLEQERSKNSALSEAYDRIESQKKSLQQASQAKSMFLAHMSHEIRTPLHTVIGYARLLQKDPTSSIAQKESAEIIESSGSHLLSLVNEVLDFSKIEAGKARYDENEFVLWDCVQAIDSMFSLQCEQKNLGWNVHWDWPKRPSDLGSRNDFKLRTDEQKLRQVLINLLNNSVKFTESGEVRLTIKAREQALPSTVNSPIDKTKITIEFEVEDTGVGIPEREKKQVLDAFNQGLSASRVGGTGLGLSIASRFIELLGGELRMQSKLGEGTRFSFQLTALTKLRTDRTANAESGKKKPSLLRMSSTKALVAEDNDVNRQLLVGILRGLGIDVTSASNGREAFEAFGTTDPDIVFMDLQMPVLDGIQACRQIREHVRQCRPNSPPVLVAVSASAFQRDKNVCLEAGFDEFLPKPFDERKVIQTLARHMQDRCVFAEETTISKEKEPTVLPSSLLRELREAAEIGSIEDIDRAIKQAGFANSPPFSDIYEIQDRCRRYDFDGIQRILERLSEGNSQHESEKL